MREQLSNFSALLFQAALDNISQNPGPAGAKPTERLALRQPNHKLHPAELEQLVAAYESGTSIKALGRQFNVHEQTARAHLHRSGVKLRPQRVVTPEQAAQIVDGYRAGASLRELSVVHGVPGGSVRNYLLRAGVVLRPAQRYPGRQHLIPTSTDLMPDSKCSAARSSDD